MYLDRVKGRTNDHSHFTTGYLIINLSANYQWGMLVVIPIRQSIISLLKDDIK